MNEKQRRQIAADARAQLRTTLAWADKAEEDAVTDEQLAEVMFYRAQAEALEPLIDALDGKHGNRAARRKARSKRRR